MIPRALTATSRAPAAALVADHAEGEAETDAGERTEDVAENLTQLVFGG